MNDKVSETTQPKTLKELREHFSRVITSFDPIKILQQADEKINKPKPTVNEQDEDYDGEEEEEDPTHIAGFDDSLFQAMALYEFENGVLLSQLFPVQFRTFGINMLQQLQKDYNCTLVSEKALAELATVSYIRVLDLQQHLNYSLAREEKYQINITYISVLGKELDRANRQFLNAIQTLKMMKQPPLQFNIKANTAVVGQNQLVQANSNE